MHAKEARFALALENFMLRHCSIDESFLLDIYSCLVPGRHTLCDVQSKHELRCLNAFPC